MVTAYTVMDSECPLFEKQLSVFRIWKFAHVATAQRNGGSTVTVVVQCGGVFSRIVYSIVYKYNIRCMRYVRTTRCFLYFLINSARESFLSRKSSAIT